MVSFPSGNSRDKTTRMWLGDSDEPLTLPLVGGSTDQVLQHLLIEAKGGQLLRYEPFTDLSWTIPLLPSRRTRLVPTGAEGQTSVFDRPTETETSERGRLA